MICITKEQANDHALSKEIGVTAMRYNIKQTEQCKLFGLNPVQMEDWETQQFLEYADTVIEDGTHDAINVAGSS